MELEHKYVALQWYLNSSAFKATFPPGKVYFTWSLYNHCVSAMPKGVRSAQSKDDIYSCKRISNRTTTLLCVYYSIKHFTQLHSITLPLEYYNFLKEHLCFGIHNMNGRTYCRVGHNLCRKYSWIRSHTCPIGLRPHLYHTYFQTGF